MMLNVVTTEVTHPTIQPLDGYRYRYMKWLLKQLPICAFFQHLIFLNQTPKYLEFLETLKRRPHPHKL